LKKRGNDGLVYTNVAEIPNSKMNRMSDYLTEVEEGKDLVKQLQNPDLSPSDIQELQNK